MLSRAPGGLSLSILCLISLALAPAAASAQTAPPSNSATGQTTLPAVSETLQVTATRVPEDVEPVPSSVTVLSGDELLARGATDLSSALSLVAGVAVPPGGDSGPASFVPELWGLREFDAFLLVVDGVPWGGAFNPALPSLDLTNVDRIEILRGAAPALYGATSFVGVIHVIHRAAGATGSSVQVSGGSYGTASAAASLALPATGGFQQSLTVNGETVGYRDDRTEVDRGHLFYRASKKTDDGVFHFDLDGSLVNQKPASPRIFDTSFSPLVPLDANHNFHGAKIDENRVNLTAGYDRDLGQGNSWSTTLALTRTDRVSARGFLTDVTATDLNANGYRQTLTINDLYFDTHLAFSIRPDLRLIVGLDHLYGAARDRSSDFDYFASLDGKNVPNLSDLPGQGLLKLVDDRNFSGLYLQSEWTPTARWRFQLGLRLNHTRETLDTLMQDLLPELGDPATTTASKTVTRGSGTFGVSYLAWSADQSAIWVYGDYRNAFKPAALDFGPDADGEILNPETAESYELGAKGRMGGRFDWEVSVFQLDFSNLVVARLSAEGFPTLANAGSERFRGGEVELEYRFRKDLSWRTVYSLHDARFRDFTQIGEDGDTVQQAGHRLPLSARNMAATSVIYYPSSGWNGNVLVSWIDRRFLDEDNLIEAPAYTTWSAGLGYRFATWELRLDGQNLNDTRPPVAISEIGGGQPYLLPARTLRLTWRAHF
ncbi:MAG TPA: TonB-dependent receptor [Thermoanaerobaculia bacterium]